MRSSPFAFAVLSFALAACSSADLKRPEPLDCTKTTCTCEEDPSQDTCKGLPGLQDGGTTEGGATPPPDAGDAGGEEADASSDAG